MANKELDVFRELKKRSAMFLMKERIGLIGAGNMGRALLSGFRNVDLLAQCRVVEANPSVRSKISRRFGVAWATVGEIARRCSIVILAVKPHDLWPVVAQLREQLPRALARRPLVISIAAGVRLRELESALGPCPVVRVMPNLAAKLGKAMSVIARGRYARGEHVSCARGIFSCVGIVEQLPERLFDTVTAISGSGPAYFFAMIRALREAGVRQGLDRVTSDRLVLQTAVGSVHLAQHLINQRGLKNRHPTLDELIAQVASKGGTTEAALKVFAKRRLSKILDEGVVAAARRSRQLASSLKAPKRRSR